MTEIELKIYEYLQEHSQYVFSADIAAKSAELDAVNSLESNGYISVKARTIGYVIAEVR